jgi:hypothetical protein
MAGEDGYGAKKLGSDLAQISAEDGVKPYSEMQN